MGKLVGDKYGIHRVIEPQGVLTQAALKIDNDMTKKTYNEHTITKTGHHK